MAAALLTLKNGGVRLIGADDSSDSETWVWHDLSTLKSLDAKAQLAFDGNVPTLCEARDRADRSAYDQDPRSIPRWDTPHAREC